LRFKKGQEHPLKSIRFTGVVAPAVTFKGRALMSRFIDCVEGEQIA